MLSLQGFACGRKDKIIKHSSLKLSAIKNQGKKPLEAIKEYSSLEHGSPIFLSLWVRESVGK